MYIINLDYKQRKYLFFSSERYFVDFTAQLRYLLTKKKKHRQKLPMNVFKVSERYSDIIKISMFNLSC